MTDIICKRKWDHTAEVKGVSHTWSAHANEFDFGFGGAGAGDLALNILLEFGLSRDRAWSLHEEFKWAFVAKVPHRGGVIRKHEVMAWIERKSQEYSGPDPGPDAA